MKKCKHQHQCMECIQEEIKELQAKINLLKGQIPNENYIDQCIYSTNNINVPTSIDTKYYNK